MNFQRGPIRVLVTVASPLRSLSSSVNLQNSYSALQIHQLNRPEDTHFRFIRHSLKRMVESKHSDHTWVTEQASRVETDIKVSSISKSIVIDGSEVSHDQPHRANNTSDGSLGFVERSFSAAGAAVLSAILVNPLDVAKVCENVCPLSTLILGSNPC